MVEALGWIVAALLLAFLVHVARIAARLEMRPDDRLPWSED